MNPDELKSLRRRAVWGRGVPSSCPFTTHELHELYCVEGRFLREIAEAAAKRTGGTPVLHTTVLKWMQNAGIPRRTSNDSRALRGLPPPRKPPIPCPFTDEELRRLAADHATDERIGSLAAKRLGRENPPSTETIRRWLRRAGAPYRRKQRKRQ